MKIGGCEELDGLGTVVVVVVGMGVLERRFILVCESVWWSQMLMRQSSKSLCDDHSRAL